MKLKSLLTRKSLIITSFLIISAISLALIIKPGSNNLSDQQASDQANKQLATDSSEDQGDNLNKNNNQDQVNHEEQELTENSNTQQSKELLERDLTTDNKSLTLPFIKNEGQVAEEVAYYASVFSGTVFVTAEGLTYSLEKEVPKKKPTASQNFNLSSNDSSGAINNDLNLNNSEASIIKADSPNSPDLTSQYNSLNEALQDRLNPNNSQVEIKQFVFREAFVDNEGKKIPLIAKGQERSIAKVNKIQGGNKSNWRQKLESYNTIDLGEVWPNIEVKLKAKSNNLEKFFVVNPGAKLEAIQVALDGVEKITKTPYDQLALKTPLGKVLLTNPVAYQYIPQNNPSPKQAKTNKSSNANSQLTANLSSEANNSQSRNNDNTQFRKKYLAVSYQIKGDNTYGFSVEGYDPDLPLIIDPLIGSTFVGGSADERYSYDLYGSHIYTGHLSVIDDDLGNIYVLGHTKSTDYPTTTGVIDQSFNDSNSILKNDIVISKFNSNLTELIASTYLGGSSEDNASSIALDSNNNVYITGFTRSSKDFPVVNGVNTLYQGGDADSFVVKLSNDLSTLMAGTYLGGSDKDFIYGLDVADQVYLTGDTYSSDFPVTSGALKSTLEGTNEGFITSLSLDLTNINASSFIGGGDFDYARAIRQKPGGDLVVTGSTTSLDFPVTSGANNTASAYDQTHGGGVDSYVAIVSSSLSQLKSSTLLGGALDDEAFALGLNNLGQIVIAGNTTSSENSFPISASAYDQTHNSTSVYDGYVAVFNSDLSNLEAATYFGGNRLEEVYELAIDSNNNIFIAGHTTSSNLEANNELQGSADGFIAGFTSDLASLTASTYLGGTSNADYVLSVGISQDDRVIAYGLTDSTDFPVTINAYDPDHNGQRDMFVSKLTKDLKINQTPSYLKLTLNGNSQSTVHTDEAPLLKITAKDELAADVLSYNGDYTVVITGAADGPDGTLPSCQDKDGNPITLGNPTVLSFIEGVATCQLSLTKAQTTSLDASIDTLASTTSPEHDLDLQVKPGAINPANTNIDVATDPIQVGVQQSIEVKAFDQYQNPLTNSAGQTIELTLAPLDGTNGNSQTFSTELTGANQLVDNSNGTYAATYPYSIIGIDSITGVVIDNQGSSITIGSDGDPSATGAYTGSDGQRIVMGIDHLALTISSDNGQSTPVSFLADNPQTLTIKAEDYLGNILTEFDGYRNITLQTAADNNSPYSLPSTCTNQNGEEVSLGSLTSLRFTAGEATCTLQMRKSGNFKLEATDQNGNTTDLTGASGGDDSFDLNLSVSPGAVEHLNLKEQSQASYEDNELANTAGNTLSINLSARDQFGNQVNSYTGTKTVVFSGANPAYGTPDLVGNKPQVASDSNAFVDPTGVSLVFSSGAVDTSLILYAREQASINATIPTDSIASTESSNSNISLNNLDLNLNTSSTGVINHSRTTISAPNNPAGRCGDVPVIVTIRDQYGNRLEDNSQAAAINLAITGANSGASFSYINNNDGTFTAQYPATLDGADQISGSVDGNSITQDTDGTSDGTFNLSIAGGGNTLTWEGDLDNNWFNAGNWDGGQVPSECSDVIIKSSFYVGTACFDAESSPIPCAPTLNFNDAGNPQGVGSSLEIASLTLGDSLDLASPATLTLEYANSDTNTSLQVAGDIIINEKGVLTHTANSDTKLHTVNLEATNLTINASDLDSSGVIEDDEMGKIDAIGKGYVSEYGPGAGFYCSPSTGGGHGGQGGRKEDGNDCQVGQTYGSIREPITLGSPGGKDSYAKQLGGSGGGAVKITTINLNNNGVITATGENGIYKSYRTSGGGSGGSVYIITDSLAGTGTIEANGGDAIYESRTYYSGAPGGGGRVAVYYDTATFDFNNIQNRSGESIATTGTLPSHDHYSIGGAGTTYLKQTSAANGDLIISNAGNATTNLKGDIGKLTTLNGPTSTDNNNIVFDNLTLKDRVQLEVDSSSLEIKNSITGNNLEEKIHNKSLLILNDLNYNILDYDFINYGDICYGACDGFGFNSVNINNGEFIDYYGSSVEGLPVTHFIINDGGVMSFGSYTLDLNRVIDNITINPGGILTHEQNIDTQTHILNLESQNITINATDLDTSGTIEENEMGMIDTTGKGYSGSTGGYGNGPGGGKDGKYQVGAGGGAYGGNGGTGSSAYDSVSYGGYSYGSIVNPASIGSSGGEGWSSGAAGAGGGLIMLNVSGTLFVDGAIRSYGSIGRKDGRGTGGGGSGGAINLNINNLEGSGKISADGGGTEYNNWALYFGGTGGGGRIAIKYDHSLFDFNNITAKTGENGNIIEKASFHQQVYENEKKFNEPAYGGAGTIYIKDKSASKGDLKVKNRELLYDFDGTDYLFNAEVTPQMGSLGMNSLIEVDDFTVSDYASYVVSSNAVLEIHGSMSGLNKGEITNDYDAIVKKFTTLNEVVLSYSFQNKGDFCMNECTDTDYFSNFEINDNGSFIQYQSGNIDKGDSFDITVNTGGEFSLGEYLPFDSPFSLDDLVINAGGNLTHEVNTADFIHSLNLEANNIDLSGTIDVSSKGYSYETAKQACNTEGGCGGPHASFGGVRYLSDPESEPYGNIQNPNEPGVGGTPSNVAYGTYGGGVIKLKVNNILNIDGTIKADGGSPIRDYDHSGSGAGGSINIDAHVLNTSSTPAISANGGHFPYNNNYGAAGSGGRIAIYYQENNINTLIDNISATSMMPQSTEHQRKSGGGTIYLSDKDGSSDILKIDNHNVLDGKETLIGYSSTENIRVTELSLTNGAKVNLQPLAIIDFSDTSLINSIADPGNNYFYSESGKVIFNENTTIDNLNFKINEEAKIEGLKNLTLENGTIFEFINFKVENENPFKVDNLNIKNGGTLTHSPNLSTMANALYLQADNLTIEPGGKIDVSGKGFTENTTYSGTLGSGAGHGGPGGNSSSGTGGVSYDDEFNPASVGSRGSDGGAGGGFTKIIVEDTFTNNGEINADGLEDSSGNGGGSGGGILISTQNLSGSGSIFARGGNATSTGGSGAGGRIAVFYEDNTGYSGTTNLNTANFTGGTGGNANGGVGTFYYSSFDHYELTGEATTQDPGTSQEITITLKDNYLRNASFSGERQITLSGAAQAPDGTKPTCTDQSGNEVALGLPTTLYFIDGVANCTLTLHQPETVELEATDGLYDTLDSPDYDLDIIVPGTTTELDISKTEISTSVNGTPDINANVDLNETVDIQVTFYDRYGNQVNPGEQTVNVEITGPNPNSLVATDGDNDGVYTTSYTPSVAGEDQITANIQGLVPENLGDGSDGELTVSTPDTIVNDYAHLEAAASAGANTLSVNDATAFSPGDQLLVIQMQDGASTNGATAGAYEFIRIDSISGTDLILTSSLTNNYDSGIFNQPNSSAAQVVRVPEYTNVTIEVAASLTAKAWDGYSGGIAIFRAQGAVDNQGEIAVSGKGYRGGTAPVSNGSNYQYGYAGERTSGASTSLETTSNAILGGGGAGKGAEGSGGGGGYGSSGSDGDKYLSSSDFGRGATAYGNQDLSTIYLGSGGGSSGTHSSGRDGVAGGSGGGIVWLFADSIANSGQIDSDGNKGADGIYVYNSSSGSAGGGGAGGSVYLAANTVDSSGQITADLGAGGLRDTATSRSKDGGSGGQGRIRINANNFIGSSNPLSYEQVYTQGVLQFIPASDDLSEYIKPIPSDTDGTSDGVYHQLSIQSTSQVDHLEITGNSTFTAGKPQSIIITAKDASGNPDLTFEGTKTLIFSGASPALAAGYQPQVRNDLTLADTDFNTPVTLEFSKGRADTLITLYKAESASLEAGLSSDGSSVDGASTIGDPTWDLDVTVNGFVEVNIYPNPQSPGGVVNIELDANDQYGNSVADGTATAKTLSGSANEYPSLDVTNNNDGTYSASYTADNLGIDKVAVTFNGQNPLETPYRNVVITECSGVKDYSGEPISAIELESLLPGETFLPNCVHTIIVRDDQDIALFEGLQESADLEERVADIKVSTVLNEVRSIKKTRLKKGSNAESSRITISTPGSGSIEMFDDTTIYSNNDWDGSFDPLQDTTISRLGYTTAEKLSAGKKKKKLVFDKPAKVVIPTAYGDPYFTVDEVNWLKIDPCDNATSATPDPSLSFPQECYIEENGETIVWTYHFTTFGSMTPNAEIILANNNASQAPGAIELSFTSGNKIPDGGQLTISFPDLFTAADIPDLLDVGGVNYLTTFTDDGLDILPNVTAASLENNVLTITFDAVISTDSQLNLVLADGVIDQNPDSSGQFGISLLTKDQSGSPLGTGIVSAKIGDGVGLRAVVQEALILTTNNNEVNLVVDPSVNLGRDISQTTTLTVATNAPSYNIEAKLVNTQTTNSSLYNTDSGTEIFSSTYAAANNNENYFGFSLGTPFTASTFAESTFSSTGTNLFSSPAAGITNAQNYTIYYDLNVDFLTQAGKYEGMIYYTAVPTF